MTLVHSLEEKEVAMTCGIPRCILFALVEKMNEKRHASHSSQAEQLVWFLIHFDGYVSLVEERFDYTTPSPRAKCYFRRNVRIEAAFSSRSDVINLREIIDRQLHGELTRSRLTCST